MGNSEFERIRELDNSGAEKKPFKDWTLARVGVGRKEGSGAFATLAPTQFDYENLLNFGPAITAMQRCLSPLLSHLHYVYSISPDGLIFVEHQTCPLVPLKFAETKESAGV